MSHPVGERKPEFQLAAWFLTAVVMALSGTLIVRLVWLLDRGFDFTDQSFYLMLAQRPAEYELTYGLFGYGLHPLYELFGGGVADMQRTAALLLALVGAMLGLTALRKAKIDWRSPAGAQTVFVSASLPLCYYLLWVPMPSYNWFALAGGLVLLTAMLHLLDAASGFRSAVAAALAAVLIMMTRPNNAVGYAGLYLAALFLVVTTNKERLTQIARAASMTAIAVIAIAAVSPVSTIADQIKAYISIFGTTHPIRFSFYDQQSEFLNSEWQWWASGAVLVFALLLRRGGRIIPDAMKLALLVMTIFILRHVWHPFTHPEAGAAGTATGIFAFCALSLACLRNEAPVRLIAVLGIGALIPWAATLGTSSAVRSQLVFYIGLSTFIGMFGISMAARWNIFAVTLASCVGLYTTYSAIGLGLATPYRLAAPVAAQLVPTEMGWGSVLKVDSKTSEFVASLRKAAAQSGFCQGDMAIDLSGSLPGAVFAIGGRMPVFPWLFAGYPFTSDFAREYLKRLGQTRLALAWLVTSDTRNSLSMQELQSFGVNFSAYRLVANLPYPIDGASVRLYAPPADQGRCESAGNGKALD
jgi:hypothetical protein